MSKIIQTTAVFKKETVYYITIRGERYRVVPQKKNPLVVNLHHKSKNARKVILNGLLPNATKVSTANSYSIAINIDSIESKIHVQAFTDVGRIIGTVNTPVGITLKVKARQFKRRNYKAIEWSEIRPQFKFEIINTTVRLYINGKEFKSRKFYLNSNYQKIKRKVESLEFPFGKRFPPAHTENFVKTYLNTVKRLTQK